MLHIRGNAIFLRALEPEDLEFIYQIENDVDLWEVSNTVTPYSRFLIRQYLENAHLDIYEVKQLRLVICDIDTEQTLGLIDLFEFDPKNNRAGVGIVIQHPEDRGKGAGAEALELVINYGKEVLGLHQLYANISVDNYPSQQLFLKYGFKLVGIKKDWERVGGVYKDEALYQLLF
ncbi:GNAT family N-acetyltransferase [Myroides odoratimimus]|uniref:GNAT family N-acetyltransferase n=1 Tax=Myroides odoratimimus TaxID=76832 RepID=UPI001CE1DDC3|nr:GNAT family protein [Myroides odoratimimus]MCA4793084.1 GNAT family N-acetyltransferase [Myroides odoratimimus]MCA4806784.1 GNAT family N-acetyltransferase [Myroides odoratimimus]MCA4820345.1 GNAT family N-acetyltransferase [Myroides odoratimimus]MCO7723452.1 GNAT family N-acetyltransferase [Myroides odoratimimus]MCS7473537.1 GNAT family N-acetyltransferase [Myroides odoratimimus]